MAGKKISELTEVLSVDIENDYVVIARSGDNKKLKVANMMGSTNLGDNFVDLKAKENGKEYRLIINDDGKVQVFPKEAVEGHVYAEGDNLQMPLKLATGAGETEKILATASTHGIVINQVYGGGNIVPSSTQSTSVSHSFIELYNRNDVDINLCGLFLHYKGNGDPAWQTLALRGILPAHHAFLVRGKQHGSFLSDMVRCKIFEYDQEFVDGTGAPVAFGSDGMSVYLSTSAEAPKADDAVNKYLVTYEGTTPVLSFVNKHYVDLLGVGGKDETKNPSAYNKFFHSCMDKDTAIRRIDFYNNTNNVYDAKPIDYKTCNIDHYRPRSLKDGVWDNYCDKIQPNLNMPNLVNITFGATSDVRFFTWQSKVSNKGFVKFRRIQDEEGQEVNELWKQVESSREIVFNHNVFMTIHRAELRDLVPGLYEYKCGEPGEWSDEEMMEVRSYDDESEIKILVTTDQQGFTGPEYVAWDTCVRAMQDIPELYNEFGLPIFDAHINTGDISQNASNLYEWLYYSDYAREFTKNIPHMTTCGNNDLVEKKYGTAYEHYVTFENVPMLNSFHKEKQATVDCPMVSSNSWDLGFVHFININSNEEQMYNDYGIDKTEFLLKQAHFLDKDLWEVCNREVKPKWIIVYAHLSPFTITRANRLQHWVPILEHYGVDVFICGHNHTYSRSIPLKTGYSGSTSKNDFNTYVPASGTTYKVVDEKKADGSEIDRSAHPADGVYYLMYQTAGAKISGKEKAIDLSALTLTDKDGNVLSAGTPEYDKHFKPGTNRPWWYEYTGTLPVQPCFYTIKATADKIDFEMNYVSGIVSKDKETAVQTIQYYDKAKHKPVKYDELTINFDERQPAYRTGGVTAPYYEENK
jgi:hypothetical protein